jgi:hypothetical protein
MSAAGSVQTPAFADLLAKAVSEPGVISQAYSQFHQYSIGNQLLAMGQCLARGIVPGPMATFQRWKDLGRYVRKGEKAITLCQPITIKVPVEDGHVVDDSDVIVRFTYRPKWFVLAQTDGAELPPIPIPEWDTARVGGARRDGDSLRRDRRQHHGLRATADDRCLADQSAATQDAISRAGARAAWPHQRRRADRGLQRARAQGKRLGRPKARPPIERLQKLAGLPVHVAAERLGVSSSTVKRWRRFIQSKMQSAGEERPP